MRDEALSQLSGIDGCIFVHMSGFIGGELQFVVKGSQELMDHVSGNHSKQGAIEMAKKALAA